MIKHNRIKFAQSETHVMFSCLDWEKNEIAYVIILKPEFLCLFLAELFHAFIQLLNFALIKFVNC
jgi:hypothetical protein